MDGREIRSVKVLQDGLTVTWRTKDAQGQEQHHQQKGGQYAHPDIDTKLQKMRNDFAEKIGAENPERDALRVLGVIVSVRDGKRYHQAVMERTVPSGQVFSFTTHVMRDSGDAEGGASFLTDGQLKKLVAVLEEGRAYLDGKRGEMPENPDDDPTQADLSLEG